MTLVKCDASWDPRFGGMGGRSGSAMVTFERSTVASYIMLSIVTISQCLTIRPHYLPLSVSDAQVKSTGGGSVCGTIWGRRGWLTDVRQILTRSGRDMGLSYATEIVSYLFPG